MTAYALFHGWVQDEIDGIQLNGKNYSTSQILTLEADNAALTARIKELEAVNHNRECANKYLGEVAEENGTRAEALETQLAAAKKALTAIASHPSEVNEKTECGSYSYGVGWAFWNAQGTARAFLEDHP